MNYLDLISLCLLNRFHLLSLCLHVLIHSSSEASHVTDSHPPTSDHFKILSQRRIFREKIVHVALTAFADVDDALSTRSDVESEEGGVCRESQVLQSFLHLLRRDLSTTHPEYGMRVERETEVQDGVFASEDRDGGPDLSFLRTLPPGISSLAPLLNTGPGLGRSGDEKKSMEPLLESILALQLPSSPWEGVQRAGSLLCALLLHRLDLLECWGKEDDSSTSGRAAGGNTTAAPGRGDSLLYPLLHPADSFESALLLPDEWYQCAMCTAWQVSPALAVAFARRFRFRLTTPELSVKSGVERCGGWLCCGSSVTGESLGPMDTLRALILNSPQEVRHLPMAAELALLGSASASGRSTPLSWREEHQMGHVLEELSHWAPLSLPAAINLWARLPMRWGGTCPPLESFARVKDTDGVKAKRKRNGRNRRSSSRSPVENIDRRGTSPVTGAQETRPCNGQLASSSTLHESKPVAQYLIRSLNTYLPSLASDTLEFFLPQLVQLLRRDPYGLLTDFLTALARASTLICHRLVWLLRAETLPSQSSSEVRDGSQSAHGLCFSLLGADPLPSAASLLLRRLQSELSPSQREYLHQEYSFFSSVTSISAKLKNIPDKSQHNAVIRNLLSSDPLPPGLELYLPTSPRRMVTEVLVDSGVPLQSASKCPFLLAFRTQSWQGPCDSPPAPLSERAESKQQERDSVLNISITDQPGVLSGTTDSNNSAEEEDNFSLRREMLSPPERGASDITFSAPRKYNSPGQQLLAGHDDGDGDGELIDCAHRSGAAVEETKEIEGSGEVNNCYTGHGGGLNCNHKGTL